MNLFKPFQVDVSSIELPSKFTFPFYYEPHELSIIAAHDLQLYLESQTDFEHNFGLDTNQKGIVIGKMFGVLVCKNQQNQLGYLWAFSGKLANSNQFQHFVPTVYDMLNEEGFYKKGEKILNQINHEIEVLENSEILKECMLNYQKIQQEALVDIDSQKKKIKELKIERDFIRLNSTNLSAIESEVLELELSEQSKSENILLKKMIKFWNYKIDAAKHDLDNVHNELHNLKAKRKQLSSDLQQQLFKEYSFLNAKSERMSLGEIFLENPPAGAGECCAPKLLHYAYQNNLQPICMAEFWWGQSPKSEIRKHKQFYPACKSKCEPILLQHMLKGLEVESSPFEYNSFQDKEITIVYQDESIIVINKPHEFLSVPGKQIQDSVYYRIKKVFPLATGPLVAHRLDMSTSGLMIVCKTEEAYKKIQMQFINRSIKKRYLALLDGKVMSEKGQINLPLRVDLEDRPRQLVCYEYGKEAVTEYEVIEKRGDQTLVYFYPLTGRTHQLRVHASHDLGLQTPIFGDDLYGKKADRLYLQAQYIEFIHPYTKETIAFELPFEF